LLCHESPSHPDRRPGEAGTSFYAHHIYALFPVIPYPNMALTMFTIGHSTRTLPELVGVLQEHGVKLLVDVRSIPKSGTNPQFNREHLAEQLPGLGLRYMWLGKELGGLRKRNKASELNAGWDNASFRGTESLCMWLAPGVAARHSFRRQCSPAAAAAAAAGGFWKPWPV
jgi:hypothetical protein